MISKLKNSLLLLTLSFSIAQGAFAPSIRAGQEPTSRSFQDWVGALGQDLNGISKDMPVAQFGEQCDRNAQGQIIQPNGNHNTCWLHMIFQAALVRAIAEGNNVMVEQLLELQFDQTVQSEFLTHVTNPENLAGAAQLRIPDHFSQSHNPLDVAAQLLAARNEHKVPDNPVLFFKWLANNRPVGFFPESPNQDLFEYVLDTYKDPTCPSVVAPLYLGYNTNFDQFFSPQVYQTPHFSEALKNLIAGRKNYLTVNVLLDMHWVTLAIFRNTTGRISYVVFDSLFAYAGTDNDLKGSNPGDKAKVIAAVLAEIRQLGGQMAEYLEEAFPQTIQNLIYRTESYGENMGFGRQIALLFVQASRISEEEAPAQEQLEQARAILTVSQTELDSLFAQLTAATEEKDALVERLRQETQSANDAALAQALAVDHPAPEPVYVDQVFAQNPAFDQLTQEITRLQNQLAQTEAQNREAQEAFNQAEAVYLATIERGIQVRGIAFAARATAQAEGQQPNPAQDQRPQPPAQLSPEEVNEVIGMLLAQPAQATRVNTAMQELAAAQAELEAAIANQTAASERLAAQPDIDNPSPEVLAQIDQANAVVTAAQARLTIAEDSLQNALDAESLQPFPPLTQPDMPQATVSRPAQVSEPVQEATPAPAERPPSALSETPFPAGITQSPRRPASPFGAQPSAQPASTAQAASGQGWLSLLVNYFRL